MKDWSDCRWGDLATLEYGKGIRDYADAPGEFPVYGTNGQIGWHRESLWHGPGVVIGRKGAYRGVHYSGRPFFVIDTAFFLKPKVDFDMRWAYYQLLTQDINGLDSGSAIPSTSRDDFYRLGVRVPPLPIQRRIAEILGRLDDKIEVNRRINRTLEAMAQALYRHWFVDFGPFQEGEFVESAVGLAPRGWEVGRVGDVVEILDRLRVPLSNMERAKRPGPYRYFGATGVVGYIDDYIFDGIYVLTGEDGSVITARDTPVVQYVFGQFWVNNHAHVLQGRNGVSTEHVKVFLDQTNVRSFVTGAVQPKISQANLRSIPFLLAPPDVNAEFDSYLQPWFAKIRAIEVENEKLAATRDYLLPRLLAGEVEV